MRTSLFHTKTHLTQQISYTLRSPGELLKSRCLGNILIKSQCQVRACMLTCFSCIQLCITLRTVVCQAPPSRGILQATNVGCHALLQVIFLIQGSNPYPLHCRQFFTTEPLGKAPEFQGRVIIFQVSLGDSKVPSRLRTTAEYLSIPLYEFSPEK